MRRSRFYPSNPLGLGELLFCVAEAPPEVGNILGFTEASVDEACLRGKRHVYVAPACPPEIPVAHAACGLISDAILRNHPDEGLELPKSVRERLLRQKKAVAAGERGKAFENVVRRVR